MKRLLLATLLLLTAAAHAETWRFVLIGDTPYDNAERRALPHMFERIAAEQPAFIAHAGDIKSGSAPCSNTLFRDRHALFDAAAVPLIYVPGDNEWTDCSRIMAGGFDPLERLQKLREIFFAEPFSLGKNRLKVERQSAAYPEHQRWRLGPALFLTLNVPGGNNNYGRGFAPGAEFLERNPLTVDWLRQGFATARREKSAAIVVIMQANPGFKHFAAGLAHSGFRELLETLREETQAFSGQVLLVHGDTHTQRIDHPLRHSQSKLPLANFTRVETFGNPFMGWTTVTIDSERPQRLRFAVHPYLRKD
ncbi:MAG: metallophosphoesterase [Rhodocyclaceae bacterium]